jgi:hypothetical protein
MPETNHRLDAPRLREVVRGEAASYVPDKSAYASNNNIYVLNPLRNLAAETAAPSSRGRSSGMATEGELRAAEIASAEARVDTKIARLEGKIDTLTATLSGKLDGLHQAMVRDHDFNRNTRWVIAGLIVASFAGLVAVMAYGGDQFGRGLNVRDVIQSTLKDFEEKRQLVPPPTQPLQGQGSSPRQ